MKNKKEKIEKMMTDKDFAKIMMAAESKKIRRHVIAELKGKKLIVSCLYRLGGRLLSQKTTTLEPSEVADLQKQSEAGKTNNDCYKMYKRAVSVKYAVPAKIGLDSTNAPYKLGKNNEPRKATGYQATSDAIARALQNGLRYTEARIRHSKKAKAKAETKTKSNKKTKAIKA